MIILRQDEMGGDVVACVGDMKNIYKTLVQDSEGKRPLVVNGSVILKLILTI
jgi:hypothetical protein